MGKGAKRSEGSPKEPAPATAAAQAIINESRELNAKPPKTSIHRLDPETGDRKYVARVTTDIATEEWLARKFGPGTYVLTHQVPGDTGAYEYHSRDTFIIDESSSLLDPPEGPSASPSPAAGASSPAVALASTSNILERAMEAGVLRLLEQSNKQFDLQAHFLERITKQDTPRGPSLLEIIAAATPIITAIINSRKDPTETAVALAGILNKRDSGGEQMAAMFERGINIATKFANPAAGGDGGGMMPVVVGEGIKVLGGIVDAIVTERRMTRGEPVATIGAEGQPIDNTQQPPGPRLVPDTDTARTETMPPTHSPAAGGANDRLWISVARGHLPLLLSAARFMPATSAAETIAANLSPTAFEDLLTDIEDTSEPGFARRLAAVFPQLEGISPQWFADLVSTLLEIGTEVEELEPPPAPPAKAQKLAARSGGSASS
jgi:hypothetical protein